MSGRLITFVVEFAVIFAVWLTFMIMYHVGSGGRWRTSDAGRHLMELAACFVWNAGLVLVNVILRDYPGRSMLQVISYGAFALIGVRRIVLMLRWRRQQRSAQADPGRAAEPLQSPPGTPRPPGRP